MTNQVRMFVFLVLASVPSRAQIVSLSSVSASAGGVAALQFSIASPPGKEPLAMQWELTIPAARLELAERSPYLGRAAQNSGKSIKCSGAWKKPAATYSQRCILAGGLRPLENGVIATLEFNVPKGVVRGTDVRVALVTDVVTKASRRVRLAEAHGLVRITN